VSNQFDVIIIGGGVVGTAVARELSRYKMKIALLEKEVELAFGVSKSNSGIIHPGTQNPPSSLKGRLCVQGNQLTRKLSKELGFDFRQVGELIVAFNPADLKKLKTIKADAQKLGVKGLKIVGPQWLKTNEPNLNPKIIAALYAPTAAVISPYRLVYALAENAAQNGVKIFTGHKVTGIQYLTPHFSPASTLNLEHRTSNFSPRFTLTTTRGTFQARYLINAAGLYADEIAQMVGIKDIIITPRKGEEYLLDKKLEGISRRLIFPLPTPTSKGILVIKTADGNPMIGPTAKDTTNKEDLSTTEAGLSQVLAAVQQLIPCINQKDIIAYFAGLRPVSGSDFIIRREKQPNNFINVAGIQSPGLTAAPAIALLVVKLLKQSGLKLKKKTSFKKNPRPLPRLFSLSPQKAQTLIKKNYTFGDIVCRCEMVSAQEIRTAIQHGAQTLDGIKFRTRAQAGRCHGSFCTTRLIKIMQAELKLAPTTITKRGPGSNLIKEDLNHANA
jgi:glycerol-3-phosphate dehydrogenase